ncbi:GbsR/MarR family transcriptional regulator [Prosthecobacter sp.]|uniref:GbsR/MarR family transcriptional regulator n=1 Tax=Prosthecobacter sp. TaxID=1965333 RepID=UPI003784F50D
MPSLTTKSQLSGGMLDWDRELRRFIDAGGNTTHSFGLGRLIGRMFALIYLHPRPISLEEIAEQLQISKASASTTVRQLEKWHAVTRIEMEGDRRDFYKVETRFSLIMKKGLLPNLQKKLRSAGGQIDRVLAAEPSKKKTGRTSAAPSFSAAETQEIHKRLIAARSLHQKLDRILSSNLLDYFL